MHNRPDLRFLLLHRKPGQMPLQVLNTSLVYNTRPAIHHIITSVLGIRSTCTYGMSSDPRNLQYTYGSPKSAFWLHHSSEQLLQSHAVVGVLYSIATPTLPLLIMRGHGMLLDLCSIPCSLISLSSFLVMFYIQYTRSIHVCAWMKNAMIAEDTRSSRQPYEFWIKIMIAHLIFLYSYTVINGQLQQHNNVSVLGQLLDLLSSILTILLTCPNNDTLLCYSNNPVYVSLLFVLCWFTCTQVDVPEGASMEIKSWVQLLQVTG